MIAAGVNAKALSTFMGHSNIAITPRPVRAPDARLRSSEAAGLLDAFLTAERERAEDQARAAEPRGTMMVPSSGTRRS